MLSDAGAGLLQFFGGTSKMDNPFQRHTVSTINAGARSCRCISCRRRRVILPSLFSIKAAPFSGYNMDVPLGFIQMSGALELTSFVVMNGKVRRAQPNKVTNAHTHTRTHIKSFVITHDIYVHRRRRSRSSSRSYKRSSNHSNKRRHRCENMRGARSSSRSLSTHIMSGPVKRKTHTHP